MQTILFNQWYVAPKGAPLGRDRPKKSFRPDPKSEDSDLAHIIQAFITVINCQDPD